MEETCRREASIVERRIHPPDDGPAIHFPEEGETICHTRQPKGAAMKIANSQRAWRDD